jgi:hypothetical protein
MPWADNSSAVLESHQLPEVKLKILIPAQKKTAEIQILGRKHSSVHFLLMVAIS